MLLCIILMGTIYSIHSSRKLESMVRENIVFMYLATFQQPVFSTILLLNVNIMILYSLNN